MENTVSGSIMHVLTLRSTLLPHEEMANAIHAVNKLDPDAWGEMVYADPPMQICCLRVESAKEMEAIVGEAVVAGIKISPLLSMGVVYTVALGASDKKLRTLQALRPIGAPVSV